MALDAAIDEARRRRADAIRAVWVAEAGALREQVAALRREADQRQVKTDKLLAELERWEGCRFEPAPPSRQPRPGPVQDPKGVTVVRAYDMGRPDGWVEPAPVPLADLEVVYRPTPKTQVLRQQAAALEAQAAQVEARDPAVGGEVSATTADELLAQVRALDPMTLGPSLAEVEAWARPAEERQRARLARLSPYHDGYGAEPSLTVCWKGGVLHTANCRAVVPALDS